MTSGRTRSKPHINAVSRELHFNAGKTRSLSNTGGSMVNSVKNFAAANALNDSASSTQILANKTRTDHLNTSLNRSQRSGLMPSASQPANV